MAELDELERYFTTQFEQLDHVCKSASPWIFICLSIFVEFLSKLSKMSGSDRDKYIDLIAKRYPARYRNFKYHNRSQDLPKQIYIVLRNGLVHTFSLTPNWKGQQLGGRQRSVRLFHRKDTELKNVTRYPNKSHKISAAVLVAEDFLEDTRSVAMRIIRRARRDRTLRQYIINFLRTSPPIAGADQGYFWLK
jgi:hypothetical protein